MTLEQKAAEWAAQLVAVEGWEPGRALLRARRAYGLEPQPQTGRRCALAIERFGEQLAADLRDLGPDLPRETRRALLSTLATSHPGVEGERTEATLKRLQRESKKRRYVSTGRPRGRPARERA